jgi:hypothetical protein
VINLSTSSLATAPENLLMAGAKLTQELLFLQFPATTPESLLDAWLG